MLPFAHSMMRNRPAQPDTWWGNERIKEQYFVSGTNHRLDECLLLLTPVTADNPDIVHTGIAIGHMPVMPLFYVKWCALELNGPASPIGMLDEDVSYTIRLR